MSIKSSPIRRAPSLDRSGILSPRNRKDGTGGNAGSGSLPTTRGGCGRGPVRGVRLPARREDGGARAFLGVHFAGGLNAAGSGAFSERATAASRSCFPFRRRWARRCAVASCALPSRPFPGPCWTSCGSNASPRTIAAARRRKAGTACACRPVPPCGCDGWPIRSGTAYAGKETTPPRRACVDHRSRTGLPSGRSQRRGTTVRRSERPICGAHYGGEFARLVFQYSRIQAVLQ